MTTLGSQNYSWLGLLQESTDFAQQLDETSHTSILSLKSKLQDLQIRFLQLPKEAGNPTDLSTILFQQHFQNRIASTSVTISRTGS